MVQSEIPTTQPASNPPPLPPLPLQALLAAIIESADDAIVSKDLHGIVTSWNPAAERIFGYTAVEMVGESITCIIPPERADEEPEILRRLARGERIDHFETVRVRKDGTRVEVSVTISPIRDGSGQIVGASKIARDITGQRRLEVQLREHAEQLQLFGEQIHAQNEELQMQNEELAVQNEQLAEADRQKDQFLAMLAHELRNPLAPVAYAVHLLRSQNPNGTRYLDTIERQIQHLRRLLDDLLDVSRLTRGTIQLRQETVDLGLLVYSVTRDLHDYVQERRQVLTVNVAPGPIPVHGDPVRLAQVITNLINNAIKFTPPEGSIEVLAGSEDEEAVLRVRDNGVGIDSMLLPRIFDLFTQADQGVGRAQGGLGVGLTVVRSLVSLHGGSVEAHSDGEGRGAEFVVRLPLVGGQQRARLQASREHRAGTSPRRVLVVDDVRDSAELLADVLRSWGHTARTAFDGPSALAEAAAFQPELVFLDLGMPGMDGYEVARRMRQDPTLAGCRLIALTGYGHELDRRRTEEIGFDQHLTKPVDPDVLRAQLA